MALRTISPLSAKDGGSVLSSLTAAPAEVSAAAEILNRMKASLGSFGKTLDSLGQQTMQMIEVGGEAQIASQIGNVRKHMEAADQKQDVQIVEIQELLKEVLEQDIIQHLTELVEAGIMEEIDTIVAEQVAALLPQYIPQDLHDELRSQQRQLEEAQKELHNSESRRANSTLRSHRLQEKVHTLYPPSGEVSHNFPNTLGDIFAISDTTAASLVKEYQLGEPAPERERNINTFMQHCGIQYQL